jgi:hypothetical protein
MYYAAADGIYCGGYGGDTGQYAFTPITESVKDIKLSADNKLYVLTDTALYIFDKDNGLTPVIAMAGGIKFSVNIKTRNIFILTAESVLIYGNDYSPKASAALTEIYEAIETDFSQNIYLLGQDKAVKLGGAQYADKSEYIFDVIPVSGVRAAAVSPETGDA